MIHFEKMGLNLKIQSNINISHQTIKNILDIEVDNEIKNRMIQYSGYYAFDEQFIKTKPKKRYRLLLYDYCV